MKSDDREYSLTRYWVGLLTEPDGCLDPLGRRNRHLRKCRVMASWGMTLDEKADLYRAQQEFFPELSIFGVRRWLQAPGGRA